MVVMTLGFCLVTGSSLAIYHIGSSYVAWCYECIGKSKMLRIPKWLQWAVGHETTLQVPEVVTGSVQRIPRAASPKQGWRSSLSGCSRPRVPGRESRGG